MAYSINQVRHLYVAKALKADVNNLVDAGDILPKADAAKTFMYFQYMSPGGLVASDKIDIANIMYAKATPSGELAHKLLRFEVTLDPTVNGGLVIPGQNYILRVAFRQYIGLSEEDQYFQYGEVLTEFNMTPSNFYRAMALSLANNLGNNVTPLLTLYLKDSTGASVKVTKDTKSEDLAGTYSALVLEEVEQDWVLGMMPQAYIPFTPQFLTITVDGLDRSWGVATQVDSVNTVGDGHNIADLEYFCMGARGDIYRGMGYPNIIRTTYLVDPTKIYDTLDIHYFYTGDNESVQKSEKTITLVAEDDGAHTDMKALIVSINALLPADKQIIGLV